jgi:16S rRNA (guanine966-N2)-methyltransferase
MRIISGKYKSRKIFSVPVSKVHGNSENNLRPTTDSARETLFNVLSNRISFEGIKCLDLFAGTGSFGFECISRGAESADFVEISGNQIQSIKKTAKELQCEEQVKVYKQNALHFLKEPSSLYYDLIFADPTYNFAQYSDLIKNVLNNKFRIFVLEFGSESNFLIDIKEYDIIDKKAGITNFKIFVANEAKQSLG